MKFSSRGFTLVELMIVIAIIGILAAALFPSLTAYLKRSRDAGRAANLQTITTAVGAYYSDKEAYPIGGTGCTYGINNFTSGTTSSDNYFPKGVPNDPKGSAFSPCGEQISATRGYYGYGSNTNGTGFIVSAVMENVAGGNFDGSVGVTGATVNIDGVTAAGITKGEGKYFLTTNN